MRRILAIVLTAVMALGLAPVSAAIVQNGGKGTPLAFEAWVRNSPSSGIYAGVSAVTGDETFGTVYRYTTTGTPNGANYTTYKSILNFNIDETVAVTAGDRVFISFYYRVNTAVGDTAYAAPTAWRLAGTACRNATTGRTLDISQTDVWQYASFVTSVYDTPSTTAAVHQYMGVIAAANTDQICVDIADPKAVYMGAVTQESGEEDAGSQVFAALSETAITSLTVGGTAVDLTENPAAYTAAAAVTAEDIAVSTAYGIADKVTVAADGDDYTIKLWPPAADWRTAQPYTTYTVSAPEPPYVEITENGGKGTVVLHDNADPTYVGSVGRDRIRVETLSGAAIAEEPFDRVYSWTRDAFSIEGTSNTSYMSFDVEGMPAAKAGDWVYVSFYYRVYNRFTDTAGTASDGHTVDLYPSIRSAGNDNPYYRTETAKYIRITADAAAEDAVSEWQRLSYIQKLEYDTDDLWTLKLANPLARNTADGIIECNGRKLDIAGVQILYFGSPSGNTTDEDVIKSAIQDQLETCGLTKVYVNGAEVKSENPLNVTIAAPRHAAGENAVSISGDTVFGAGTANVVQSKTDGNVYYVKSYAPAYDFLDASDTRYETYTVTVEPTYDFYGFALKQNGEAVTDYTALNSGPYTLELLGDNGTDAPLTGVLVAASYASNGTLLRASAAPFSLAADSTAQQLSAELPGAGQAPAYIRFYILDGFSVVRPYVKAIETSADGLAQ